MNFSFQREAFRNVLRGDRCVHPASVFDPISARIAEDLGFEVGMFAGSVASLTILGAPDIILITLTEFAEQAYRICRAGRLPLLVDADHGYGNALNVMRTVEELESAGVSALTIEDTALPAGYGSPKSSLISIDEAAAKLRAAVRARQDPGLVIVGRCQAFSISDTDDAVARAKAYVQTGVDAMFFVGVKTRAQLEAVRAVCDLPMILGSAAEEVADPAYLATMNVRVSLQGHQPFAAAVQAVHTTLKALREGTPTAQLQNVAGKALMDQVTRQGNYTEWTREYLGG
jgi:carboxyvinyl-carboxyphosphonate phosphorylmutase